jgi:hypothetical protein
MQTSMLWVGCEPTIPAFERAIVIGTTSFTIPNILWIPIKRQEFVFFFLRKRPCLVLTENSWQTCFVLPHLELSVLPQAVGNMQNNISTCYNIRFQVLVEVNMSGVIQFLRTVPKFGENIASDFRVDKFPTQKLEAVNFFENLVPIKPWRY